MSPALVRVWSLALAATVISVVLAVYFVDAPVAHFVSRLPWSDTPRSPALGLPVLVTLSAVVVLVSALMTTIHQPARKATEVLALASFSLTWSFCVNEFALKFIFGRETPDDFLQTGKDAFHAFYGTPWSSFPSGHAVQIVSVLSVFMMTYPKHQPVWIGLMGAGLAALVLGNWHFVSDVIAGAAFGGLGGTATVTLWRKGLR